MRGDSNRMDGHLLAFTEGTGHGAGLASGSGPLPRGAENPRLCHRLSGSRRRNPRSSGRQDWVKSLRAEAERQIEVWPAPERQPALLVSVALYKSGVNEPHREQKGLDTVFSTSMAALLLLGPLDGPATLKLPSRRFCRQKETHDKRGAVELECALCKDQLSRHVLAIRCFA